MDVLPAHLRELLKTEVFRSFPLKTAGVFIMNLFWKIFRIILVIALGLILVAGCALAFYYHSAAIFYRAVLYVFVISLGVCGITALVIVPIDLYIEDKKGGIH
jgi:hypothetical protein